MWSLISKDERLKLLSTILPQDLDKEKFIYTNNAVFDAYKKNLLNQKLIKGLPLSSRGLIDIFFSIKKLIPIVIVYRNVYFTKKLDDPFIQYKKKLSLDEINILPKLDENIVKIDKNNQDEIKNKYKILIPTDDKNIFSNVIFPESTIAIRFDPSNEKLNIQNAALHNIPKGTLCNIIGFYYNDQIENTKLRMPKLGMPKSVFNYDQQKILNNDLSLKKSMIGETRSAYKIFSIDNKLCKNNEIYIEVTKIAKFDYLTSLIDIFETNWKNGYIINKMKINHENQTKNNEYIQNNIKQDNILIHLYEIFCSYPMIDKYFKYFHKNYVDIIKKYSDIRLSEMKIINDKKKFNNNIRIKKRDEDINSWLVSQSSKSNAEIFNKQLKKYRDEYDKLFETRNVAIIERENFDNTIDEKRKYAILDLIFNKYAIKKIGDNNQYYLKDIPSIAILCEHEIILSKIFKLKRESTNESLMAIGNLYSILENQYFSTTIDNDDERFIYCVYCGKPIFETDIKMHNTFDDSGNLNATYTTKYDLFQSKIMKQIDAILSISQLIFINKGSIILNSRIIYDSIYDIIESYRTEEELENIINIQKDNDFKISKRLDRTIAEYAISRIIYGIIDSGGLIYPRGQRKKLEKAFQSGQNELTEYLIDWGIKKLFSIKMAKINYRPFPDELLSKKDKIKENLKKIIQKLRRTETKMVKYSIHIPIYYKYNENYESIIKKMIECLNKFSNDEEINICISRTFNNKINIYDFTNYLVAKIFAIETKYINEEPRNTDIKSHIIKAGFEKDEFKDISRDKLKDKSKNKLKDIKKLNNLNNNNIKNGVTIKEKSQIKSQIEDNHRNNTCEYTGKLRKIVSLIFVNLRSKLLILRKNLKNKYLEKFTNENIIINNEISELIKKEYNIITNKTIIEYFQFRCFDGTPHLFNGTFCTNCGRIIDDLDFKIVDEASKKEFEKYKKQYDILNNIPQKEQHIRIIKNSCAKEIQNKQNVSLRGFSDKINRIFEDDITDKIKKIAKTILGNIKLTKKDENNISSIGADPGKINEIKNEKLLRIFQTDNSDDFYNLLLSIGSYKNRENELLSISNKRNEIIERYARIRVDELYNGIVEIIRNISVICNTKILALIRNGTYGNFLSEIIESGIANNLNIVQKKIDDFITISELNNIKCSDLKIGKLKKLFLGIYINLLDLIIHNKNINKKIVDQNRETKILCRFVLFEIENFLMAIDDNDKTKEYFINKEMNYDLDRYRKEQKYLNLSMEEKIEEGILNMSYEEQEEYFRALDERGNDYFGINIESTEKEIIEPEDKYTKSIYKDGLKMDITYDYENEDTIEEREELIDQQ
jgi:hypothetical protein